jgi:hypothetical protein
MSRIRLQIDRLVLTGFQPLEGKALAESLRSQLSEVLSDRIMRREWAHSHRTEVLHLGRMSLEAGCVGADKFGARMARAVGKGLKS